MNTQKYIIIPLTLIIVFFWASLANQGFTALPEKGGSSGTNHALIIGISNYQNFDKLQSPVKDATEIARILTEKYDFKKENVILLTDKTEEKPTRNTILSYLDEFVSKLTEKDNLIIFFSGHSAEDEKEETYWIPIDGKKDKEFTWLQHSDLCDEFIGSENFKAKNVCILTDSPFTKSVLKPTSIVLTPYDLRYTEKIMEQAQSRSREVMAFNDKHWPGSEETEGYGLFTYYLRKALINNWLKVIDLENLLFDEDVIIEISKIAGTRLLRGRLKKSSMEKGGQTVITRVISPPVINVVDSYANPKKGFVGDRFIIEAKTSSPAFEVYLEIGGKQYVMDGAGTQWKHSLKIASLGTVPYNIIAINADDVEGKPKKGEINTIPLAENMVNVTKVTVKPEQGTGGDVFAFDAVTDVAAKSVELVIGEKRYEMTGSGTNWSLDQDIESVGTLDFSIIARNQDGLEGRSKGGILIVTPPKVNVVTAESTPAKGYAGDEFNLIAKTDFSAESVSLLMGGVTYAMEGSGKEWNLKRKIPDIGKIAFTVIAKNSEGIEGQAKKGELITEKRPLGIPDITTVALSPPKIRAGENFIIKVNTSSDAKEVTLELEGKKYQLEGSGTEWKYSSKIESPGTSKYILIAKNEDDQQGAAKEGSIEIQKVAKGIDVANVEVNPKQGNLGQNFTFKATTVSPAAGVSLIIGDKRYDMTGSGTNWTLERKIDDLGSIDFYVIAKDDKDEEGSSKSGVLVTKALLANITNVEVAFAAKGFIGEEFQIKATTDQPAASVSLEMDDITYKMEGSDKNWIFKKQITEAGKKDFSVVAKNIEGIEGKSMSGELVAKLAIPDVTLVAFDPEQIFAGDSFIIKVTTSTAADKVFVDIDGKKTEMQGSGTEWRYQAQFSDVGAKKYKITAQNNEGAAGAAKEGDITIAKKPAPLINIAKAEISPKKGYAGGKFTFTATTDSPAEKVTLTIGKDSFDMTGSGSEWTLSRVIEEPGDLVFSIAAINEDQVEGGAKTSTVVVEELKERYTYNDDGTITDKITGEVKQRFLDNNDGTVTDLASNLMWLKEPKRIASTYDEADDYCRTLDIGGKTGWRLPTLSDWKTIVDRKQQNPSLPPGHPFTNINTSTGFWSKTKHKFGALYVYQVNLWNGKTAYLSKKEIANVWAVRYAGEGEQLAQAD